jgi:hypothetical protein
MKNLAQQLGRMFIKTIAEKIPGFRANVYQGRCRISGTGFHRTGKNPGMAVEYRPKLILSKAKCFHKKNEAAKEKRSID